MRQQQQVQQVNQKETKTFGAKRKIKAIAKSDNVKVLLNYSY